MVARRSGLGKGLASLIPSEVASESSEGSGDAIYLELPVGEIVPNPNQPRQVFDEESLASLTASVRELGVLQPVLVRAGSDGRYELIAGERRWRAARRAARQRRSPAMSSKAPSSVGRTSTGWSTPTSRIDAASPASVSSSKAVRG